MIEINGWISIHITTDGEDNSEELQNAPCCCTRATCDF